jgi:hypothetical protein
MTLFEVEAVYGYWQDHPPTHLLLAACFGVEPRRRSQPNAFEAAAGASILAIPGMKQGAVDEGLKGAALDFGELKRRHEGQG